MEVSQSGLNLEQSREIAFRCLDALNDVDPTIAVSLAFYLGQLEGTLMLVAKKLAVLEEEWQAYLDDDDRNDVGYIGNLITEARKAVTDD